MEGNCHLLLFFLLYKSCMSCEDQRSLNIPAPAAPAGGDGGPRSPLLSEEAQNPPSRVLNKQNVLCSSSARLCPCICLEAVVNQGWMMGNLGN